MVKFLETTGVSAELTDLIKDSFKQKIQELKEPIKDNRFMNDLKEVSEDFNTVDSEGWPDEEVSH